MKNKSAVFFVFVLIAVLIVSCGKNDNKTTVPNDSTKTTDQLVTKDSSGKQKVKLRYNVKKGDKFVYKMVAKTNTVENSLGTENKDVQQDNEIHYYYNKEAQDVDANGIITYKVKYDSVTINAKMGEQNVIYNSNINDTVKSNPAFMQYNAVVGEQFFIRVSPEGEINDVYGLETIYEKLFKALGDTLKEEEKNTIKESFGKESIREILQQEYQIFPKNDISVDSSWTKTYNTGILVFELLNNAQYTLKGIENKDGNTIANIEAILNVEFKSKEAKEQGITLKILNSETGGTGKIAFNLSRGCIVNKETQTNLNLDLLMSAKGQSAKAKQKVSTNLYVNLLN